MKALQLVSLALGGLLACTGDTGQVRLHVPVSARGAARDAIQVGDARFSLSRAEIGFGPVYFCATEGAELELCQMALAEQLATVTLDGLSAESSEIGSLQATTGSVRSAAFDYGISWLLTQSAPQARPGAPGGHSAVLEGSVDNGSASLRFSASVDIEPLTPGDAAVNARPTSVDISGPGARLTVSVDPYRWLERIDVDKLFALDADGDGEVEIGADDQAYQAIVQGMTNRAPVAFEWSR